MNKLQKTSVICLLAGICCLLWGSAFPCVKIGYSLFSILSDDWASQLLFAGIRFTLAGVLIIVFISLKNRSFLFPQKKSWGMISKLSIFQTILQYLCFYIGLGHTTGVKSSIIVGSNVFVAIVISAIFFRLEHLSWNKIIGCIIGFIGIVIINVTGNSIDFHMSLTGEGMIFGSTIAYAISSVLIKSYSKHENPVVLSAYQFIIGGIVLMLTGILAGGHMSIPNMNGIGIILYLALISSVAYTLWSLLLSQNLVSRVAVFGFMNPVFGVLTSIILLPGEKSTVGTHVILALFFVIMGILLVNFVPQRQTIQSSEKDVDTSLIK